MNTILELKNINKIYGKEIKTQVLYDVNLSFAQGSFNSIIGQSGSGKSTLLNIMGTLDKPTDGTVIIDGKNASEMSVRQLAALRNDVIGFVFQFHYQSRLYSIQSHLECHSTRGMVSLLGLAIFAQVFDAFRALEG